MVGGAGCPVVCQCPAGPASCPPGVSLVADGCGCCKVCATQLNQDCHEEGRPCDHHKGLECNYGNDVGRTHGICRAKAEGRSCEYGGRIYQSGEDFRAGCKHQCTCIDGAVGCIPLCPSVAPLATPACPAPRLRKVPGQCCLSLDCHASSATGGAIGRRPQTPAYRPHAYFPFVPYPDKPYRYPGKPYGKTAKPYPESPHLYPHKPRKDRKERRRWWGEEKEEKEEEEEEEEGRLLGNELVDLGRKWEKKPRRLKHLASKTGDRGGRGQRRARKCSRTHKAPEPHRLSYAGCRTTRLYRPNYCGVCRDGRCCAPRRTRTAAVTFACADGDRFERDVMFIQSCKCSDRCDHLNDAAMTPQRWLYGDTHKFLD
ncbi:hypothetical protein CRUP_011643 [Coryphaenoides rupestris]|nr:hypothetical protein CRUP_011643 [Coryphaenoides rupestris]